MQDVAPTVQRRANTYGGQLQSCEEYLKDRGCFFDWF